MKTQTNRASARLSKNGKYVIVNCNGQNAILNANLLRYLFDVPYTRKDGTRISSDQIFKMKQNAQMAYDKKVQASMA